jgi:hypothetical protein
MYKCQHCGQRFEQFEVLGQCPHCHHLSKVQCACGYMAEGWEFVKNNDCCPKCNKPFRLVGGTSEHNKEIKHKEQKQALGRKAAIAAAVVGAVVVVAGAVLLLLR